MVGRGQVLVHNPVPEQRLEQDGRKSRRQAGVGSRMR